MSIRSLTLHGPSEEVACLVQTIQNMSIKKGSEILYTDMQSTKKGESNYHAILSLDDQVDLTFTPGLVVDQFMQTPNARYQFSGTVLNTPSKNQELNQVVDLAKSQNLEVSGELSQYCPLTTGFSFTVSGDIRNTIDFRKIIRNSLDSRCFEIDKEKIIPY